jgi:hypothetical protein
MSQFYVGVTAGSLPPSVPTSFVTDNGTAIPVGNILNILANETNVNNDNGIQTIGSVNTVTVQLTNRVTGTVTTTDATPTTLLSSSLGAVPGVYITQGDIIAYDVTDSAGAYYTYAASAITDGITGTEIAIENKNVFKQPAMVASDFSIGVVGNSAVIVVTGIAGKTIRWSALFTYRFVG